MGCAVAVALAVCATPAAADSVAYVKDGEVWLSTTDGSRQYQVTTDGGYSTVSQADSLRRWFQDPAYPGAVSEAVMSRDKSAMITVTDDGRGISILRSAGRFYPDYPERCGRAFWAEADGIHAASLPRFAFDSCGTLTDGGALLVPGAKNPSWGPADVPPARPRIALRSGLVVKVVGAKQAVTR